MEISVISKLPARKTNGCLIAPVYKGNKLPAATVDINDATNGLIDTILKAGDLGDTAGSHTLIHQAPGLSVTRVLLIRVGAKGSVDTDTYAKACLSAVNAIQATGATQAISLLSSLDVDDHDMAWKCQQEALIARNSMYVFTGHDALSGGKKSKAATDKSKGSLQKWCHLVEAKREQKQAKKGAKLGNAVSIGCDLARDLGNLAPNICTPTWLASQAKSLQKLSKKLKVTVLDEAQMKKLGMGAFLSVSQGSRQPGKMISMEYRGGAKSAKPAVLLGKGVTFDTGGISIKPSATMDEMKYDMCGAASVFGAMRTCVELDLKCNLICVVAAAENMPDGDASRPGDVITSMSGQTVEILNTDAEGRLVMCDALTWIEKFKPAAVIDVATLTGACIVALGHQTSALMANDQSLAEKLLSASQKARDKTWQLPLWDEYQSQLDSNFADMANIGGRPAGSITAGCFLSRFAKEYPWAHLDIAGIAWHSGKNKGATGRPVPLLVQYILDNHVDPK